MSNEIKQKKRIINELKKQRKSYEGVRDDLLSWFDDAIKKEQEGLKN